MSHACEHANNCGGCEGGEAPNQNFYSLKTKLLDQFFFKHKIEQKILIRDAGLSLRDRVDLTFYKNKLGFWDKTRSEICEIAQCLQMSPELSLWYEDFKKEFVPKELSKGSVRLRISPEGKKGVWLDFSHEETLAFLSDKMLVEALLEKAHVEVGQRFKNIIKRSNGDYGLCKEKMYKPWFLTYVGDDLKSLPLYSLVGSFTQTGFKANKILINEVLSILKSLPHYPIQELFCGLGNFTFPLASTGRLVHAHEVDATSLEGLRKTQESIPELASRIQIHELNLYQNKGLPALDKEMILFVDPPRSGLKNVLTHILQTALEQRPDYILYVSCFAESLISDLTQLYEASYEVQTCLGVDQFPQGPHCEWLTLLKKR